MIKRTRTLASEVCCSSTTVLQPVTPSQYPSHSRLGCLFYCLGNCETQVQQLVWKWSFIQLPKHSGLFKCPLPLTADLSLWSRVSSQILKPMLLYGRTEYNILLGARDMAKSFIFLCPILRAEALRKVFISWPFAQAPYFFPAVSSFSVPAWTRQTEVSLPAALVPRDRNLWALSGVWMMLLDLSSIKSAWLNLATLPEWAPVDQSSQEPLLHFQSTRTGRPSREDCLNHSYLFSPALCVEGQQNRQIVGEFTRIWADRGFIEGASKPQRGDCVVERELKS